MRTINTRSWFGDVTIENIAEIAEAIKLFLTIDGKPRYYTFVALNEQQGRTTDIRTSLRVKPHTPFKLSYSKSDPARNFGSIDCAPEEADFAQFSVGDTYGAWGFSTLCRNTTPHEERLAKGAYVAFGDNKLTISQLNGYGETLVWTIAPEQHVGEPYWTEDGTSYHYKGELQIMED